MLSIKRVVRRERPGPQGVAKRAAPVPVVGEVLGRTDLALATVSHEMRNLLVPILLWAGTLREGTLTEEESRCAAARLEESVQRLTGVVADLFDRSRILAGTLHLVLGPVDAASVARAAVDLVRPIAERKGVRVDLRAGPRIPLVADQARLHQILGNLVSNAVKFTPPGGGVGVSARRRGTEVELTVTDTGEGIPIDFIPHLFEPFRQAARGDATSAAGLGLGLTIVRHLVELHGGRVWAESEGAGKGATFVVVLPRGVGSERTRGRGARRAATAAAARGVPGIVSPGC